MLRKGENAAATDRLFWHHLRELMAAPEQPADEPEDVTTRYRRLLVPLNGAPEAEAALPHAAAVARAFGANVQLVRVVAPTAAAVPLELPTESGLTVPLATGGELAPETLGASIYLEDVAERLRAQGITTETYVDAGPVAPTLLSQAALSGADLIVISTHARGGIARLVLGSVADELLRGAPCPVMVVHAATERAEPQVNRVRSFAEDLAAAGPLAPVPIGLREVPVQRIVGSVGRARELDANFVPLSAKRRSDERFRFLRNAMTGAAALPPIKLYKLGYDYYVLDGHHRVAIAKEMGIGELEAEVTEYVSESDSVQQRVFAERREFERETLLTRVGASRPGTYPRLMEMIRSFAEADREARPEVARQVPAREQLVAASSRWYRVFFVPMAQRIRARRLGPSFPGERTADILVRLADFRAEEARLGHEVSWEAALDHFAAAYGRGQRRIWDLRRFVPLGRRNL